MKRLLLVAAGVALAAVPAVFGLTDNPSLSHSVPVRIPSGAVPVTEHQINSGRVDHGTDGSGKGRRDTAAESGKGGHGPAANPPATSGKDGHAVTASGKGGHGPAANPPATSGKDGHAAAAASGKGGHGPAASPPATSGKDGHAAAPPAVSGRDHAAPAATAPPEKGRGAASMPKTRVRGPGGIRGGGGSQGPDGGTTSGGSGSGK